MESHTYQTGTIITDGEVKWTPFTDEALRLQVELMKMEREASLFHSAYMVMIGILIGAIIGFACK